MRLPVAVFPILLAASASAQQPVTGFKNEYLDDFNTTSKQLLQLAEVVPEAKYTWRPGDGVRSVSEVYVHIAAGNFLLLGVTGVKPPADYFLPTGTTGKDAVQAVLAQMQKLEKTIAKKDDVVKMLKASLDSVRDHFSSAAAADLDQPVEFFGQKTTVRRIYLRIIAHVNEHYGQSIAYARVNGIKPPWSN
jgi:uncharacterized damage-inducible protein DinB